MDGEDSRPPSEGDSTGVLQELKNTTIETGECFTLQLGESESGPFVLECSRFGGGAFIVLELGTPENTVNVAQSDVDELPNPTANNKATTDPS